MRRKDEGILSKIARFNANFAKGKMAGLEKMADEIFNHLDMHGTGVIYRNTKVHRNLLRGGMRL